MRKLLALALAYLVVWSAAGFLWFHWTNASAERGRHAIVLGEQQAAQLPPPDGLPELAEACKGKLEAGTAHDLAAYVAKTAVRPGDDNTWDEVLVGVDELTLSDVVRERRERFVPVEPKDAVLLTANPLEWTRLLPRARAGSPELSAARYLVVAKYFSLVPPVNEGTDGYTRGGGAFSARVIGFRDGELLCEGRGEVHMKETVNAAGRGETKEQAEAEALQNAAKMVPFVFSLSVTTSPLHALCGVGGEELCRLTGRWVGK
jgi:hypothetical protein